MQRRTLSLLAVALLCLAVPTSVSYAVDAHSSPHTPGHAPGGRALVLLPFQWQFGVDTGDEEAARLQAAGFDVTVLRNDQVTVQVMQTISQYNVVYMDTHSDPITGGDGVVASGQVSQANDSSLDPFVRDGSIQAVTVSQGGGQEYWAIESGFVKNHMPHFPANSILILNGCGMLSAPVFALALQNMGLGALVSWDNEVSGPDNWLTGNGFLNLMSQGLSVADAIQTLKSYGLGTSAPQGQGGTTATFGFIGNGAITLAQAANSPVAAPTSTPVPGTPQPTATPPATRSPTPTPIAINTAPATGPTTPPGPKVTVQLKSPVKPGTRQVIVVKAVPDTVIHIHVRYPNGDSLSATTATDPGGTARYAYVQPADEITYKERAALVTIEGLKDGGITTTTVQYQIGWAALDVTVAPRIQAVNKIVAIWAHTQRRTPVTVTLSFPKKGNAKRFQGVTGKFGWAHFRYTVGSGLKDGTNRRVTVRARVQLGATLYRTSTWFMIQ